MLVNYNLNNLSGGISQQQPELRFDNQVEDMINFTITNNEGVVRRNPTTSVIENLTDTVSNTTPIHAYTDGSGNGYGMFISKRDGNWGLRVFDTDGNAKTVLGDDVLRTYFGASDSSYVASNVQFLTVADTTWVLCKNKVASMSAGANTSYNKNKAFYWVKRSFDNGQGAGYTYEVKLNGTSYTGTGTSTITAATGLESAIVGGGYSVKRVGSILRIQKSDSTAFTFECGDSWGNQASFGWENEVPKITDLPADMRGFTTAEVGITAVTGSTKNEFTNYYVLWNEEAWKESGMEGLQTSINNTTMPVKLVRQSDDSFVISTADFVTSKVGDYDSNPLPSFIDNTISNMFFFKDRLGFTSGESVILSETGQYYNFFATTVMEVLDSDPIDVTIDSNTVSNIRNITASNGALTLWSDNAQFLLAGGEILSPATTRISQTSSYACDNNIPPIVVDNEVIFVNKRGEYSELMIYSPASLQADKSSAESIMPHLPKFIKSDIVSLVASPEHNMVFVLTASEPKVIYVYKYLVQGNQKVMNSFFKWTFDNYTQASKIIALTNNLYIIGSGILDERFVRKIGLGHAENYDSLKVYNDVVNQEGVITGAKYLSQIVLSPQNIKTNQGSYFISEKFFIKDIKINLSTMSTANGSRNYVNSLAVRVFNKERNEYILNSIATGIEDKLYVGIDSDKATISIGSDEDGYVNIGTINVTGMIRHKTKNI